MHARAPHLEGRYTWVGRLAEADLDRLEQLTIGDRILKAEVIVSDPVPSNMSESPAP
jgi:allophanate hydrolase subunit 2